MASKFRGACSANPTSILDIRRLIDAKANIMRYQIITFWENAENWTGEEWKNWVRSELIKLDTWLPEIQQSNLKIVIDIHTPPGGHDAKNIYRMFTNKPEMKQVLREMWQEIALKYKSNQSVLAYGVLNEPAGKPLQVRNLMQSVVDVIRAIDRTKRIAVTVPYSDSQNFEGYRPLAGENLWYEVHVYTPLRLTHQGIYQYPAPKPYPTVRWYKAKIKNTLAHVRQFQLENQAKIFVGEFGFSDFAAEQSRINWFQDVISIFEDYSWHWTLHAWGNKIEPDGHYYWEVEPFPNVLKIFMDYWEKNV